MPDFAQDAVGLLKAIVAIPSVSGQEDAVAAFLADQLESWFPSCVTRRGHNLVVDIKGRTEGKSLLLCSHIDTVEPARAWTRNPFAATVEVIASMGLARTMPEPLSSA